MLADFLVQSRSPRFFRLNQQVPQQSDPPLGMGRSWEQLLSESSHDRFRVAINDGQQDAGRSIRNAPALFPILHGSCIQTETVGKFPAAQFHPLAYRNNVFCGGIVHNTAGKSLFSPHMGKHFA